MRLSVSPHRSHRDRFSAGLWLAALALLLKAMLAPGLMMSPAKAAQGYWPVELCTGGGLKQVLINANGDIGETGDASHDDPASGSIADCPYALSAAVLLPSAILQAAPVLLRLRHLPAFTQTSRSILPAALPPPAIGPPTSA